MYVQVFSIYTLTNRLAEAGHKVVGVEISERAVKDFFTESHLPFEKVQVGKLVQYKVILMQHLLTLDCAFYVAYKHTLIYYRLIALYLYIYNGNCTTIGT